MLEDLTKKVIEIVQKASAKMLEVYEKSNPGIGYKSGNSPLTEADKRANESIVYIVQSSTLP